MVVLTQSLSICGLNTYRTDQAIATNKGTVISSTSSTADCNKYDKLNPTAAYASGADPCRPGKQPAGNAP